MKVLSNNKKAYFDYNILDKIEAGIPLFGWEVKSVKAGSMSLSAAFVANKDEELYLIGSYIPSWKSAPAVSKEQEGRERKLLLKKAEIRNLVAKAKQSGVTIIPLEVYENDRGLVKILIGLAQGKKKFDKREKLKKQDINRRIESERKQYNF